MKTERQIPTPAESGQIILAILGSVALIWSFSALLVRMYPTWWTQGLLAFTSILAIIAVCVVAEPSFNLLTQYFVALDVQALRGPSIVISIDPMSRWPSDRPKPRTFDEWLDGQPADERGRLNTLYYRLRVWLKYQQKR